MQVGDVLRLEKDDFITVSGLCQSKSMRYIYTCIHLIVCAHILGRYVGVVVQ